MARGQTICSGDLNELVTIGTVTYSKTASGGAVPIVGQSAGQYWAEIKSMSGREYEQRGQMLGAATTIITMRAFDVTRALRTKDRIIRGTTTYEIEWIDTSAVRDGRISFYVVEQRTQN